MLISPPQDQWKDLKPELTPGLRIVAEWLAATLEENAELYIRPHLNGLRPSIVLMIPERGVTAVEVFEITSPHDPRDERARAKIEARDRARRMTRTARLRDEILSVYCPRLGFAAEHDAELRDRLAVFALFPFESEDDARRHVQAGLARGRETLTGDATSVMPWLEHPGKSLDPRMIADLRNWLIEPDVEAKKRRPLALSERQAELATSRTISGYRRIKGPPGSGKSQVLAARAAELAADGRQVLLVTFNITLRHYLRDLIDRASKGGVRANITITHFHDWLRELTSEAGLQSDLRRAWAQDIDAVDQGGRALAVGVQALEELGDDAVKYDALLVDEAQDFELEWWNLLRGVVRPGGEYVLVADKGQDLYGRSDEWTEAAMVGAGFTGPWTTLSGSYRIPQQIRPALARLAKSLAVDPPPLEKQQQFESTSIRWIETTRDSFVDALSEAVATMPTLSDPDPTAYADVFVLMQTHAAGLALERQLARKHIHLGHVFGARTGDSRRRKLWFMQDDARVKGATIHSFKGWESRALVVGVEHFKTRDARMEVYVALTRLKTSEQLTSYLTIVNCAPSFSGFANHIPNAVVTETPF